MKRLAIINCSKAESDFADRFDALKHRFPEISFVYYNNDVEGEVIDALHREGFSSDGIILNPAGFAAFSVSIGDAIAGIVSPVVVVRDAEPGDLSKMDFVARKAVGCISGLGFKGYELAVEFFMTRD